VPRGLEGTEGPHGDAGPSHGSEHAEDPTTWELRPDQLLLIGKSIFLYKYIV
jgi:hypothetical protein